MSSEDTKILQFNQNQKFDQTPFAIYADLKSLIKRIDGCKDNFEKWFTTKMFEHIPCGYSVSKIWIFDGIEKKYKVYILWSLKRAHNEDDSL